MSKAKAKGSNRSILHMIIVLLENRNAHIITYIYIYTYIHRFLTISMIDHVKQFMQKQGHAMDSGAGVFQLRAQ